MSEELKPCPFCGGAALLEVHEPHTHVIATFMPDHPGSATAECSQCSAAMIDDTAEKVAAAWNLRQQVPDAIRVMGERLRADKFEHCTADPMFLVQKKSRIYGFDPDYSDDRIAWVDYDGEADDETAAALEKEWNETGDEPDGWTRTGYADEWEHVTTYVTKEAAEAFAASKGDHYRVYVDSGCRNSEWQALREYLMSLAAPKPEDVK